jgi:hypothetical protein
VVLTLLPLRHCVYRSAAMARFNPRKESGRSRTRPGVVPANRACSRPQRAGWARSHAETRAVSAAAAPPAASWLAGRGYGCWD